MQTRHLILAAAALAAGMAGPAKAGWEYRDDMPEVVGPGDASEPDGGVDSAPLGPSAGEIERTFRSAYANAGQPRIAVFWNRAFSDRLSQWVASGRLLVAHEGRGDAERSTTLSVQRNTGQGTAGTPMGTLANAEFETGFTDPMLSAGAQLIDRATIMRVTESNTRRNAGHDRASDAQVIETEALKGYADYVAEITMLPDANAPGDRAFRVLVKRIPDGLIVANLVARGQKPSGEARTYWKAGADGYVKVTDAYTMSAVELGRAVALDTMQALSRAWR